MPMHGFSFETDSMNGMLERLDDRADEIRALMEDATAEEIWELWRQLDISGIYHDCALEGQVVSPEELKTAFDPRAVTDAASMPLYTTLRSHREAFELMRHLSSDRQLEINLDLFKRFHVLFASNPDDARAGRFRKDIPLHRSYFHEINEADKIAPDMRKLIAWMNDPAETGALHPVSLASRFHYNFMHIFPFLETSGKIGRVVMNLVLVRNGYLPAVIHATERQRYYEVLRQPPGGLTEVIVDSAMASFEAAVKFLIR